MASGQQEGLRTMVNVRKPALVQGSDHLSLALIAVLAVMVIISIRQKWGR